MVARDGAGAGRVLVVGGSLGGLRAAEQLRAAGWRGPVTVVGDEPHMPYNRPPLSKEALAGTASFDSLAFTPRAAAADVEWLLGRRVCAVRLCERVAVLDDGTELGFAGLVAATGLRPRRLTCPGPAGPDSGRHVLRTLGDARALRDGLLRPGVRLVVVGAGFIGCELASTALQLGVAEVTVVDVVRLPMLRPLGEGLARVLLRRHEARGVRFVLGAGVAAFGGEGRVTSVVLDDGRVLAADLVVECVGTVPNTEWLDGNGLDLSDGVRTDGQLRIGGLPYAVAVGDVARFPDPRHGGLARRVEHWSMPGDSARHAGRVLAAYLDGGVVVEGAVAGGAGAGGSAAGGAIVGGAAAGGVVVEGSAGGGVVGEEAAPFAPLPSFWSDQHGFRLRSFGAPELGSGDVQLIEGTLDEAPGAPENDIVAGYHADGRLVGVVALGGPGASAAAARHRAQLLRQPVPLA
ncbi:NAD(P)/FAD-dependent oxidoreductase [Streptomyces sp. NPDC059009]|uniref:NAD(P)/FAD-dependent oxidoreductase n=1 Tax=Streptomyces sp. NPDC059009 TaxID=3346694 RepID=UPI003677B2BE